MKSKIANKDAHLQIHVIALQQQLENVDLWELLPKPDAEIKKLQHVERDVHHLHLQDQLTHLHQEIFQLHAIVKDKL
jgi:hypothetical protein